MCYVFYLIGALIVMACEFKFCEPCNQTGCYYFANKSCGCTRNVTTIPNLESMVRPNQHGGRFKEVSACFLRTADLKLAVVVLAVLGGIVAVLGVVALGYRFRGEVAVTCRTVERRTRALLGNAQETSRQWLRWDYGLQRTDSQDSDSNVTVETEVPPNHDEADFLVSGQQQIFFTAVSMLPFLLGTPILYGY
ncbi:unnamed protein product [Allacma fusca]|uniref:Uncharacterized protein n=1 Tax=Allacma fusca TaxID=39272 RepID=A0A8J2KQH4_9HEXA|nr:unnamed protein product [Allacma fusca]